MIKLFRAKGYTTDENKQIILLDEQDERHTIESLLQKLKIEPIPQEIQDAIWQEITQKQTPEILKKWKETHNIVPEIYTISIIIKINSINNIQLQKTIWENYVKKFYPNQ
jgi:fibrillarin-like rRNA methylase